MLQHSILMPSAIKHLLQYEPEAFSRPIKCSSRTELYRIQSL